MGLYGDFLRCRGQVEVRMGRRGNDSMYTKKRRVHIFVHHPDLYGGILLAGRGCRLTSGKMYFSLAGLQHLFLASRSGELLMKCQLTLASVDAKKNVWGIPLRSRGCRLTSSTGSCQHHWHPAGPQQLSLASWSGET